MQLFQQIDDLLDSGTLEIGIENELNIGSVSFIDCQLTVFIPLKAIAGTGIVFSICRLRRCYAGLI